ncbi:MAG TPA: hypothetical protein VM262_14305 [Acidimicrobiales bacterium]|nr:hypothetical protein [Acidimicrobiales bacterium]
MTNVDTERAAASEDKAAETWGLMRVRALDLLHGVELLDEQAQAFSTATQSAYASNGEQGAPPDVEAADVAMLARLLDHVQECATMTVHDAEAARSMVEVLARRTTL